MSGLFEQFAFSSLSRRVAGIAGSAGQFERFSSTPTRN
jgi:hypothetical protein